MKKKQIFIHLGFPKTASTYLQKNLFPLMKESFYLGRPFNDGTIRILEKKILKLNETEYEQEKKNLIHFLGKIFNKTNKKYILSHEGFLRFTRYNKPKNLISNDIFQTLRRLDEIFSNYCEVNFIIVIRRYEDMLRSYLDYFYTDFKFEYNENTFLKDLRENRTNSNILKNFYYGEIIKFIEKLKINHKVLIYEDLKNNPKVFHQQLFNFIGTNIDYDNQIFNSSEINYSIRKKTLYRIRMLLDELSNIYRKGDLLKKLFKLSSYIKLIKRITHILSFKKIRKRKFFYNQFLPSKYKKEIFNFYVEDFTKLPNDIQIKCDKYNYLDK
jgi:hypothetical protein